MAVFVKANEKMHEVVDAVMEKYRSDLAKEEITVGVRWAVADGDQPALKSKGYPCLAQISITPAKNRVLGMPDAVIDVDQAKWDDMPEAEQLALIDHDLHHLELVVDEEEGGVKRDDAGRPKLKNRPHDWEVGGFTVIAQRHQNDAPEMKCLMTAFEAAKQQTFPWG